MQQIANLTQILKVSRCCIDDQLLHLKCFRRDVPEIEFSAFSNPHMLLECVVKVFSPIYRLSASDSGPTS